MVRAVRRGASMRSVARRWRVSLDTVQRWVARAKGLRLDRADWRSRPSGCRTSPSRTNAGTETLILDLRRTLGDTSILGERGAAAIRRALVARGLAHVPCQRTIGRILERRGALDGRRRIRWPAPPKGWYLPDLAAGDAEMDCFDSIDDLVIRGGIDVEIFNVVSLHGGLVGSYPLPPLTAKSAVETIIAHWRRLGLPRYAQFDNAKVFLGPGLFPDVVGRVTRLCLSLGVTPVFSVPREHGFQSAIEGYNALYKGKVWQRFQHDSIGQLQTRSEMYTAEHRARNAARIEGAPHRRSFPARWRLDLQRPLKGRIVYLRRTSDTGTIEVLNQPFHVGDTWPNRLVRADVDLDAGTIHFHALRRKAPHDQPLLKALRHRIPPKRFYE